MSEQGALSAILAEYLQGVDDGRPPDRDELLARHPDLAEELRAFFAREDNLLHQAGPLAQSAPPLPRTFGEYTLLEELGRGGMGVVYRARHEGLHRDVALKVLQGGGTTLTGGADRLQQEAEILARLEHPGIVPVYEVGTCEGQAFFAMKLIEGASLADRLGALQADLPCAVGILAAVARAVQLAHEQGVVHRDLKPANILLDAQGAPLVTDFGLALRLDADVRLTASGAVVGTPAYMAPEQATAERSVGPAADVWALGVILYRLLTGHVPFAGATPLERLHRVVSAEPIPVGKEVQGWARVLEGVCLRCLRKDPAERYRSASDLADDLNRWLRHKQPKGSIQRTRRLRLPRPGKRTMFATMFAALLVGALALWAFDCNRIAQRKVERAAFALEKGEVQLAREVLQANWTPRWLLGQPTRDLLDDALAQTAGYRADLGDNLDLNTVCFSTDGQLVRLRRPGTARPNQHPFHYFDTQTGQERIGAAPSEELFTPRLDRSVKVAGVLVLGVLPEGLHTPGWEVSLSPDGNTIHCFRYDGTSGRRLEFEEQPRLVRATYDRREERWSRLVFTMPPSAPLQEKWVEASLDGTTRVRWPAPSPRPRGDWISVGERLYVFRMARTTLARDDLAAYEIAVFQASKTDRRGVPAPPPPEKCKKVGGLHLPRYCGRTGQLSPDGKVLITPTRRQLQANIGLWHLP